VLEARGVRVSCGDRRELVAETLLGAAAGTGTATAVAAAVEPVPLSLPLLLLLLNAKVAPAEVGRAKSSS
jgi:hypothetical protein